MSDDVSIVDIKTTVTVVEDNYTVTILEGMGPRGYGLPSDGTIGQMIKKSTLVDYATEWFTLTKDFLGLGNVTDHAQLKRTAGDNQAFTQKVNPEVADSILVEDSSDGWNKKWISIDGLKTLFTAAFDLVYQPLSSALGKITESGGLPLWDGGAWPGGGGGGGGMWELLETRVLTGAGSAIFETGTDDDIIFIIDNLVFSADSALLISLSVDGGSTYPNTHNDTTHRRDESYTTYANPTFATGTEIWTTSAFIKNYINGFLRMYQVAGSGWTPFETNIKGQRLSTGKWIWQRSHGGLETNGVVNRVRFKPFSGSMSGNIKLYKRA